MGQTGEQLAVGSVSDLSRWLLEEGLLTPPQVAKALSRQQETGAPLGVTVLELAYVEEEQLVELLSRRHNVPLAPERLHRQAITVTVLSRVPQDICWQYGVFPFAVDRQSDRVQVAIVDPGDREALDTLVEMTGGAFDLHVAGPKALEKAIRKHYLDAWVEDSHREKKRGLRFFGYEGITSPGAAAHNKDIVRQVIDASATAGPARPPQPKLIQLPPAGQSKREPSGPLRIARVRVQAPEPGSVEADAAAPPELPDRPAAAEVRTEPPSRTTTAPGQPQVVPELQAAPKLAEVPEPAEVPIERRLRRLEQAVQLLLHLVQEHGSAELREDAHRVAELLRERDAHS